MVSPYPTPRYAIVRKFPVATLAPYVRLSAAALAWCDANRVGTVADVLRTMRPQGRSRVIKCPPDLRTEFERLVNPPGVPADWPLHPEERSRIEQQFSHVVGLFGIFRTAIWEAADRWQALLYLIHEEHDFRQYRGVGPTVLPKLLAWRDEMRERHAKPENPLTADVLKGREHGYLQPLQSPTPPPHLQSSRPSRSYVTFSFQVDLADPHLIEKLEAVKAILG